MHFFGPKSPFCQTVDYVYAQKPVHLQFFAFQRGKLDSKQFVIYTTVNAGMQIYGCRYTCRHYIYIYTRSSGCSLRSAPHFVAAQMRRRYKYYLLLHFFYCIKGFFFLLFMCTIFLNPFRNRNC